MALRSRNDFSRSISFCIVFSSIWNVSCSFTFGFSSSSVAALPFLLLLFLLLLSVVVFSGSSLADSMTGGSGVFCILLRSFGCNSSSGNAVFLRAYSTKFRR